MFDDLELNSITISEPSKVSEPAAPGEPVVQVKESIPAAADPAPAAQPPVEDKVIAPAAAPEAKPVDLDALIVEKTQGKFRSWTQLQEELQKEAVPQVQFADERVAKLNEYVAKGGSVEDFIRTQSLKVSELDPISAIREQMKLENDDLSADDIDVLITDRYKLDEELYSEQERRIAQILLKQDSKKAIAKLSEWQQANSVPKAAIDQEAVLREQQENQKKWFDHVDSELSGFDKLELTTADGEKVSVGIEDRAEITEMVKNPQKFLDSFGSVKELAEAIAFVKYKSKLVASLTQTAQAKATEDVLKEIKNPSHSPERQTAQKPQMTEMEELAQVMQEAARQKGIYGKY